MSVRERKISIIMIKRSKMYRSVRSYEGTHKCDRTQLLLHVTTRYYTRYSYCASPKGGAKSSTTLERFDEMKDGRDSSLEDEVAPSADHMEPKLLKYGPLHSLLHIS